MFCLPASHSRGIRGQSALGCDETRAAKAVTIPAGVETAAVSLVEEFGSYGPNRSEADMQIASVEVAVGQIPAFPFSPERAGNRQEADLATPQREVSKLLRDA
jgi:hypothetical protein